MISNAKVDPSLFDAVVLDAGGSEQRLGDLCAGRPLALLVFLRHFGCIGCSQQVDALVPMLDELHDLSVAVIFIGNGDPHAIRGFVDRQRLEGYPVQLVTDPTLRSHGLAGFARSVWRAIGPQALWAALVARSKGASGAGMEGDPFQQGGMLLVDTSDPRHRRVLLRCENRVAYEPVSPAAILEAVIENTRASAFAAADAARNGVV